MFWFFSTFVCPTEILAFSDRINEFKKINTEVIACSVDSHFTHLAWINTPRKEVSDECFLVTIHFANKISFVGWTRQNKHSIIEWSLTQNRQRLWCLPWWFGSFASRFVHHWSARYSPANYYERFTSWSISRWNYPFSTSIPIYRQPWWSLPSWMETRLRHNCSKSKGENEIFLEEL